MLNTSRKLRKQFIQFIDKHSTEELNIIPDGFKNNIIWNFGHSVVSHQKLCYQLSGVNPPIEEKWIEMFSKGTYPTRDLSSEEIMELKAAGLQLIEQLDKDFAAGLFKSYKTFVTGIGVTIHTVAEAAELSVLHEAIHLGYAKCQKKIIDHQKKEECIKMENKEVISL
ncbi:DinB family protein [Flammeovirga pectinis]|uniref:DinB family protein n=1 Tax=Flammeovirga pectinis TaxID=2494373 RepID=A0A3Q9FP60_9BACT|nr:DinB family protein [Flammeovirga pectinis]AZQ63153.1 DinB family protein [Flammeovirga pectinis]